jgi:hypothetical protein
MFHKSRKHLKLIFIGVLTGIGSLSYGREISLPSTFSSRAVYYHPVEQLDRFSCGYNVLFNAANVEHICGFTNNMHEYSLFEQTVLSYLRTKGIAPKQASTNRITEHLAQRVLHLQPFYHLRFRDKKSGPVVPLFSYEISVEYPRGTPKHEVNRRLDKAFEEHEQEILARIQTYLASASKQVVVHFLCYLTSSQGNRHGILMSLIQNTTGRGLYIFDNMNEKITAGSDASKFIEFLCTRFNVSSRHLFNGPNLSYFR